MIRVIIGYKIKKNADIQPILNKLRAHAMTYPGFIGAENLQNVKDSSIVAMFQTWDRLGRLAGVGTIQSLERLSLMKQNQSYMRVQGWTNIQGDTNERVRISLQRIIEK